MNSSGSFSDYRNLGIGFNQSCFLSFRISEMACARQDEPEPPRCPSRSSVDLFATQRDDDYQEEINMDEDEDEQVS